MSSILICINAFIFILLSVLHIYWAFGGRFGINSALPSFANNNNLVFKPGKISTLIVAVGLLLFALITLSNILISNALFKSLTYAIACIFLLRTIGDFNYLGVFKKTKNTSFATMDTRFFIPLCIYLSISTFYIAAY